MPTLIEHELVSGDTATPLLGQVVDDAGVARDISGCALRYVVYYSQADDADILLDKSSAGGTVTILDATQGTFSVPFTADDTNAIGGRVFPHEVELTTIAGLVETVGVGPLKITRDFAA